MSDEESYRRTTRIHVVTSNSDQKLNKPIDKLLRLFGLTTYGTSLLSLKAYTEMQFVAGLLITVFIFDLSAWTLLWNTIFYSNPLKIGGLTFVALFPAFLLSFATFIYERQFVTADVSQVGWSRLGLGAFARFILVVIAALITSQPIELLFFQARIEARIHQESVPKEAIRRLNQLEEARKKAEGPSGDKIKELLKGTPESLKIDTLTTTKQNLQKEKTILENQAKSKQEAFSKAQKTVDYWRETLSRASFEARPTIQKRLSEARTKASLEEEAFNQARQENEAKQIELDNIEKDLQAAQKDFDNRYEKIKKETQEVQKIGENSLENLQKWITKVQANEPGKVLVEGDLVYQPDNYDFFERLRIINDLYYGLPPRWPDGANEYEKQLNETFKIVNPAKDQTLKDRREDEASQFRRTYWTVFAVAMFIPLLAMIMKIFMPKELQDYYSKEKQTSANNEF
ncbi:MAG: DUF4407 domain-containing protein [Acidobacteria bacterium]|nr:DUF4407 domain-containing protein [Acidobacteriota bacterium]